jgi:hypothetical protein
MGYGDTKPTKELIQDRIEDVDQIAQDALAGMNDFLAALRTALGSIDPPYVDPKLAKISLVPPSVDANPPDSISSEVEGELNGITDPGLAINTNAITVDPITLPAFNELPPTVTMPNDPNAFNENPPTEPKLDTIEPVTPPNIAGMLPSLPTFIPITMPQAIPLTFLAFSGTQPDRTLVENLSILPFSFSEEEYVSTLLDAVKTALEGYVENGGTGVGEDVENDIWERKSERDERALEQAIDIIIDTWASRGNLLPDGQVQASIDDEIDKHVDRRVDSSRDISIEQANLAQKNTHHALTTAVQLEQITIAHHDNVAERALKAAIAEVEMSKAIVEAKIAIFNAQVEVYKADAAVYEARIRGEMLKAEAYRNLVETKKLEVSMRQMDVDIYKAQVEAVTLYLEMYKTEMEAKKIEAEIQTAKVGIFKAQADAFNSLVGLKVAEYGLYKAKVEGELAKVQAYAEQVKAFEAQVNATEAEADVITKKADADIAVRKIELEGQLAKLEKYKIESGVAFKKADTLLGIYDADTKIYMAEISKAEADARLEVETARIVEQHNSANVQMAIQAAVTNLNAFVSLTQATLATNESGAKIFSSLVSAALQAINASMGITSAYGNSNSVDYNYNYSEDNNPSPIGIL